MSIFVTIMAAIGVIFLLGLLAAIIFVVQFALKAKRAIADGKMRIVRGHDASFHSVPAHPDRFQSSDIVNADQSSWTSSYSETPTSDAGKSNDAGHSWDSGDSDCGSSDGGSSSSSD